MDVVPEPLEEKVRQAARECAPGAIIVEPDIMIFPKELPFLLPLDYNSTSSQTLPLEGGGQSLPRTRYGGGGGSEF